MSDSWIITDDAIQGGQPTVRNSRVRVIDITGHESREAFVNYAKEKSYLGHEAIISAVSYCKNRSCESDDPTLYCLGCSQNRLKGKFSQGEYRDLVLKNRKFLVENDGFLVDSMENGLESDEYIGIDIWKLAELESDWINEIQW